MKETILRMQLHGKAPSVVRSAEQLLSQLEEKKHATSKRQTNDKLETP
jgi:hypothetical protein